jgi:glycosyltransferase involved in cell wall biosynthesis
VKIVLITTGQPSCNPRVVKEADALNAAGFDVTLLYCFFIEWASEKDEVLLKQVAWKYKMVGGSPYKNQILYFYTRLRFKLAIILNRYFKLKFIVAERAQARTYDELLKAAKKVKADWYIGHNLGALAVAANAAKFHNTKAGFDFEDYHRGEFQPSDKSNIERIAYLENRYLNFLNYYSTASDLITIRTKQNHPDFKGKVITLLNCFPLLQQPIYKEKNITDKKLQLFWFSQTIGKGRGIEELVEALILIDNPNVTVTLVGRCNEDMKDYIKSKITNKNIRFFFTGIIQPEELPSFAANFDIGLALETGFSSNNDIALSNKIFTYLIAGNAIISSETSMQYAFNKKYSVGETFPINNIAQFAKKIESYFDYDKLNNQKKHNYLLAQNELNWENESKKLLEIIV